MQAHASFISPAMKRIYEENFAGHTLRYLFNYPDTARYMSPYVSLSDAAEYDINASAEYMNSVRPYYTESTDDAYVEYKSLINLTSRALLPVQCCLFHAAAIKWKGYAWLISGRSGAGKTTQYKNWKMLFKDEAEMICGDMPLIELRDDRSIWAHPSPWNGKERIKGHVSAPLGGIVLLEQSDTNTIIRMSARECASAVFLQFAASPENEEQIRSMAEMADIMVMSYPVWKLTNTGDLDSTKIMTDTFRRMIKEGEEETETQ